MEDAHMKTAEEVAEYFRVDIDKGLSEGQVKSNLDKYGPNGELIHRHYCT